MDYSRFYPQVANMKKSLFDQGYLDEDKLHQLEELQDDRHPNLAEIIANMFFKDSIKFITNIETALEKNPPDFFNMDKYSSLLKGTTSGIGALKMKNELFKFREYYEERNIEGCLRSLQKLKMENDVLKEKMANYFQMLRVVTPTEMAVRPL